MQQSITHINKEKAKKAHQELLTALGTENNPNQWLEFMKAVDKHLPVLAKQGRPTRADIKNSLIGQLGFTSWREMIETNINENGLGWNYNSYKAWQKAYNIIKENEYLIDEKLTASAILTLKKDFQEIPKNKEMLIIARQELEQEKANNVTSTIKQLRADIKDKNIEIENYIFRQQQLIDELQLLKNKKPKIKKLTRFEHLKAFLFNR